MDIFSRFCQNFRVHPCFLIKVICKCSYDPDIWPSLLLYRGLEKGAHMSEILQTNYHQSYVQYAGNMLNQMLHYTFHNIKLHVTIYIFSRFSQISHTYNIYPYISILYAPTAPCHVSILHKYSPAFYVYPSLSSVTSPCSPYFYPATILSTIAIVYLKSPRSIFSSILCNAPPCNVYLKSPFSPFSHGHYYPPTYYATRSWVHYKIIQV